MGWCTYSISDDEFFVDNDKKLYFNKKTRKKQTWRELKVEALIVPADSFAANKGYILKQCKKSGECKKDIGKWERKFEKIESKKLEGEKK